MQAIITKYHGPTNHSGGRVSAKCDAARVVVPWDHALNIDENHKAAAKSLIQKLGWTGQWVSGGVADGFVHVCVVGVWS